jgi:type II secretory ATPase GspE/PulE/Tfp pilus assembly ATPase PilB-like protein
MAQRLVRKLCKECAESYTPLEGELRALAIDPKHAGALRFKRPKGCRACEGTGYRGRVGLFEMLEMNDDLRELTFRGASLGELRQRASTHGALRHLLTDGARKVSEGVTATAEVLRVSRSALD